MGCDHQWEFHSYDQLSEYYECSECPATKTVTTIIENEEEDDE